MYNFISMENHLKREKVTKKDVIAIGVDMNLNSASLTASNMVTDLINNWCQSVIKWPGDEQRVLQIQDFLQREISIITRSFPEKPPKTLLNDIKKIFTWPSELKIPEKIYIRTRLRHLLWFAPYHIIYPNWSYDTPFWAFLLEITKEVGIKEFPELAL